MNKDSRILITGGSGLLGSALIEKLKSEGYSDLYAPSTKILNLLSPIEEISSYFVSIKPDYVFHLAGSVNGVVGNVTRPAQIFFDNVIINTNVVEASRKAKVKKILATGSIAAYPNSFKTEFDDLREEYMDFGEPHESEKSYGYAKRALYYHLEACHKEGLDYCYVISSKLYGPRDNFNLTTGPVISSLVRKFYESSITKLPVLIWGDGKSRRDIVYVKDAAAFLIKAMNCHSGRINLATGSMISILEIAQMLSHISGVKDDFIFDLTKPRGHEFTSINIEKLEALEFKHEYSPYNGLRETYEWYANNNLTARK